MPASSLGILQLNLGIGPKLTLGRQTVVKSLPAPEAELNWLSERFNRNVVISSVLLVSGSVIACAAYLVSIV